MTTSYARTIARLVTVLLLTVGLVLPSVGAAHGCSCAPVDRDAYFRADAAVIGTVVDFSTLLFGGGGVWSLSVEHDLKDNLSEIVEVHSEVSDGGNCGLGLREGDRAALLLYLAEGEWRSSGCSQTGEDQLIGLSAALGPAAGHGQISFIVGGAFGDVSSVAYDDKGSVLAYGYDTEPTTAIAACPGNSHILETKRKRSAQPFDNPTFVVRSLDDFDVTRSYRLDAWFPQGQAFPFRASCLSPSGDVIAAHINTETTHGMYRIDESGPQLLLSHHEGFVSTLGSERGYAFLEGRGDDGTLIEIDLVTGEARELATFDFLVRELFPSPDGKLLAVAGWARDTGLLGTADPHVMIDLASGDTIATVDEPGKTPSPDQLAWNGETVLLGFREAADGTRELIAYDTLFNPVDRVGQLYPTMFASTPSTAYAVEYDGTIANISGGSVLAMFDTGFPAAQSLLAFDEPPTMTSAPVPPPPPTTVEGPVAIPLPETDDGGFPIWPLALGGAVLIAIAALAWHSRISTAGR